MAALPRSEEYIGWPIEHLGLVPLADDPEVAALSPTPESIRKEQEQAALRDDLAAVAAKVGQRIMIPDRPFTLDEWQVIRILRSILRTARVKRTWSDLVFSMTLAPVRAIVAVVDKDGYITLGMEQGHSATLELFGTSLPLGPHRLHFRAARLANLAEVRDYLALLRDPGMAVRLHFRPGPDATLVIAYPEWGLNPNSTGLAQRLDAAERIVLLAPEDSRRLNDLLDIQQYRSLTEIERNELDALLDEHGRRLLDRSVGLYAVRNKFESSEAREQVEASFAEALTWWSQFKADPARREAAVELARQRRSRHDG
jgi:hypothetical protein